MGQGSGIIIDPRGYILTNSHVVAGSQEIQVKLYDGRELRGRLVGYDKKFDVALVQVQARGLKAVILGTPTDCRWASGPSPSAAPTGWSTP